MSGTLDLHSRLEKAEAECERLRACARNLLASANERHRAQQDQLLEAVANAISELKMLRASNAVWEDRAATLTVQRDQLLEALRPLMPITLTETEDYAILDFGHCNTEARTIDPVVWATINEVYHDAITQAGRDAITEEERS